MSNFVVLALFKKVIKKLPVGRRLSHDWSHFRRVKLPKQAISRVLSALLRSPNRKVCCLIMRSVRIQRLVLQLLKGLIVFHKKEGNGADSGVP